MSKWAEEYFGTKRVPEDCIIFLGITKKAYQKKILEIFDETREIKQREIPKSYFVKYGGKEILVIFNIYGAPFTLDILRILNESRCKNIIALGLCGTKKDIPIATIIVPSKVRCMDGITNIANPRIDFTYPNKALLDKIKQILKEKEIKFYRGQIISVPSVLHEIPFIERESKNQRYLASECELSTFLYFAKKTGMDAAAILVVRDNSRLTLHDHPKKKYLGIIKGAKVAAEALGRFA